mmetsp:Transcript_14243/g.41794  ORF Transcript_14243/g.41794 Transcript_14243/m.41794 type:complete len:183 (+) Transcript_14243:1036-1584(+)
MEVPQAAQEKPPFHDTLLQACSTNLAGHKALGVLYCRNRILPIADENMVHYQHLGSYQQVAQGDWDKGTFLGSDLARHRLQKATFHRRNESCGSTQNSTCPAGIAPERCGVVGMEILYSAGTRAAVAVRTTNYLTKSSPRCQLAKMDSCHLGWSRLLLEEYPHNRQLLVSQAVPVASDKARD